MAKIIHTMIRVLEPNRSTKFYSDIFDCKESHRLAFDDFTLIYLRNEESSFEIELTHNHDRTEPYTHGDGYGHYAFAADNLDEMHATILTLGYAPTAIKEFRQNGELLARFFFITDPDGYKIEVLERRGHYQ